MIDDELDQVIHAIYDRVEHGQYEEARYLLRKHAMHAFDYSPWKPPFVYNKDGVWIEDSVGTRILDLRGWGFLTGKGDGALGLDDAEAIKLQDRLGNHLTALMNFEAATK